MICVVDSVSPCVQDCPYHYQENGCFWEDAYRAAKPYYRTCPNCGANLDPGEVCDCMKKGAPSDTSTENATNNKTTLSVQGKKEKVNGKIN